VRFAVDQKGTRFMAAAELCRLEGKSHARIYGVEKAID
jgi:hypothetical protein